MDRYQVNKQSPDQLARANPTFELGGSHSHDSVEIGSNSITVVRQRTQPRGNHNPFNTVPWIRPCFNGGVNVPVLRSEIKGLWEDVPQLLVD
ncbi:hypothetical protein EVAR_95494_1 [Eumeta japonica]|uniref:Uncharacterized protein n=1 Tax=Eumeta variegata TaxID=151549 RepID=A0A4C1UIL8_EUMVA|nr:hypothetical protein EVAR_95494_1 [Eumeta japonica]